MTTDELELERDLKTLAEPQPKDERLRLVIRASLDEQLREHPKGRRRTRRLALGAAALAAATLAAAIVALIGTGGSSAPASANAAILAHVVRAISPPANLIVHVKETGENPDGTPVSVEWWQQTNSPYAIRMIKGIGSQQYEGSADGTTSSMYVAATDTIYRHADSKSPTLVDPLETVRAELTNGTAQVAGTVTIGGRSLYKIELPTGVVGYFDRTDFRPAYVDNPQRDGSVVRTEVITYEELSITPANDKLLSVTAQHPDASVETGLPPGPAGQK